MVVDCAGDAAGLTPEISLGCYSRHWRVGTAVREMRPGPTDDVGNTIEGLGEGVGGIGLGRRIVGQGERDGAVATEHPAQELAGVAIGDAAGGFLQEQAEEEEDSGGNLLAVEGGQGAAEVDPGAERDGAVAEGGNARLGRVVTAEDVAVCGGAATMLAVGIDKATLHEVLLGVLGGCGGKGKGRAERGLFQFPLYKFSISG